MAAQQDTIAPTWKSDGTDLDGKATWTVTTQDEISNLQISTNSGGSPANFLYASQLERPSYFFKVTITEMAGKFDSLSVGVAKPDEFKKGYKLKGMFYNGNLTNASAALKVSFGPRLKQGDTIVIEYNDNTASNNTGDGAASGTIQFKIYLNDKCLGIGFEIPKTDDTLFVPCLSVNGTMTLATQVLTENPTATVPASAGFEVPFCGKWNVTEIMSVGEGTNTAPLWPIQDYDRDIVLTMEHDSLVGSGGGGDDARLLCNLSIRVANTFGIQKQIRKSDYDDNIYSMENSGNGSVRSTRMMPPPMVQPIERELPTLLSDHWVQLKLLDSGSALQIQSNKNADTDDGNIPIIVAKCKRMEASLTEAACTSYR